MRVALNIEQLVHRPPGGIGRYTAELVRLLPDADLDLITFVARHRRSTVERALARFGLDGDAGVDPVRLLLPRPVLYDTWNVAGVPPLGLLHRRLRDLDLVHAPSLAVPPRSDDVPLIVTVHDAAPLVFPDTYPGRGRWFHRSGFRAAARRADVVIAPTQAAADEITQRTAIRSDRIQIVPHGVDQGVVDDEAVREVRRALALGDAPYVLWVGTLEPRKNVGMLLSAFRAVVAAGLPHDLVLVGSKGWLDTATEIRVPMLALGDRARLTDSLPDRSLQALYHGADLLALPSFHEGFGLPVLEAMAQETAVVCSDIPVLREVAGDAAVFVRVRDIDAWTEVLVELLRDDDRRARFAAAGRARATGFTWARCVDRTRAVYRSVT
jgi:glycosyltransferase involved in cell wall biosynthesis